MANFKDKVLEIARDIPRGKVVSYGQLALMAGIPKAAIIVGHILCGSGETAPWWRIINAKGYISTTCTDHTGLRQKDLLEKEGIKVSDRLQVDINTYRWLPQEKQLKKYELPSEYVESFIQKFLL